MTRSHGGAPVDRPTIAPRALRALAVLSLLAACGGDPPTTAPVVPPPTDPALGAGLLVSEPISAGAPAANGVTSLAVALSSAVSYVSLPPGTVVGGVSATIRNRRTGSAVGVPLVDGGFDPQPVPARVGDTLDIAVARAAGDPALALATVVSRRPPRVVRTRPPRGQTDVAVNTRLVVVFSEPVAEATVGAASVRLLSGATPVAGAVRVVPDSAYMVEFLPSAPLAPQTAHTLVVGPTVADLSGDALGAEVRVPFATADGPRPVTPVASVAIEPRTAIVLRNGQTFQLTAILQDATHNVLVGRVVVWSSSDPAVAAVSASGLVTAGDDIGTVKIAAVSEGIQATAQVSVIPANTGAVVVSTVTTGVDLDPDGYLVGVRWQSERIGLNSTITVFSLGVGRQPIWLADIERNCAATDDVPEVDVPHRGQTRVTFTVTCGPRSADGDDPLVGVWRAERFEVFRDSAHTSRLEDFIAGGMTGRLAVRRTGGGEVRWEWHGAYPYFGPDLPLLNGGSATVVGDTLRSVVDRWAGLNAECDYGPCDGALPGRHVFVRSGDRLVITGLDRIDPGYLVSQSHAWQRITLRKVR